LDSRECASPLASADAGVEPLPFGETQDSNVMLVMDVRVLLDKSRR
jgi:hypothetical protein